MIPRYTVQLLAKGAFKPNAYYSLIVSFALHTLSSVADWPGDISKIPDSKYWPICNGGESVGGEGDNQRKISFGFE